MTGICTYIGPFLSELTSVEESARVTAEKVSFFLSMERSLSAVAEVFTLYGLDVMLGKLHASFKVRKTNGCTKDCI